jgi:hypothetical protein
VPTVRRRDIEKMSALTRIKKEKERVTVAAAKSKKACNLETNTAWGDESDRGQPVSLLIGPQEPMVKIDIEGCQIDFILDTGVAISTMTTPTGLLTKD